MTESGTKRETFYIQTKYTSPYGQDPTKMPYNPQSSITQQVKDSIASSLRNLTAFMSPSEAYIDCLVLHSPFPSPQQTQEAWRAMESHVPHAVRTLGVSNIYHLPALQALYNFATVKPVVVQNRFYHDTGYDTDIRAFCEQEDIIYQSFWTLTANPHLLKSKPVAFVAEQANVSTSVALYSLVLGLGKISILNGTTNPDRMKADLDGVQAVQDWSRTEADSWTEAKQAFAALLEV